MAKDRIQEIKNYRLQAAQAVVDELTTLLDQAVQLDTKVYLTNSLKDAEAKMDYIRQDKADW